MSVQTSVIDPAIAIAGMVAFGSTTVDDSVSGFAHENLEPGLLVCWQDSVQRTFKLATGAAGEVIVGIVKHSTVTQQGTPNTNATFPEGSQLSVVRSGIVWCVMNGTAIAKGAPLRVVTAAPNRGRLSVVVAGSNPAPLVAYRPSVAGLVMAEINLTTGNAAVVA